jgi:hypothetical protein
MKERATEKKPFNTFYTSGVREERVIEADEEKKTKKQVFY